MASQVHSLNNFEIKTVQKSNKRQQFRKKTTIGLTANTILNVAGMFSIIEKILLCVAFLRYKIFCIFLGKNEFNWVIIINLMTELN